MKWRIYYSDDSTFGWGDGLPEQAPGWGVIVVPQEDPDVGRMMMHRWDHYCWHDSQWWGHNMAGLLDCLAMPGPNVVIHGRTVSQENFRRIFALALADVDFPIKSGERHFERPRGSW